jgi:hypothetical protein
VFPFSAHAVEMIDYLAENFKMRFNDFHSHVTNICMFENPFSIEVSDAPENLQLELTELQYDSILHSSFNQEALITFMKQSKLKFHSRITNVHLHEVM